MIQPVHLLCLKKTQISVSQLGQVHSR